MFDLPLSTTLLLLGFPLFWVAYTVIFLLLTRKWNEAANDPRDES